MQLSAYQWWVLCKISHGWRFSKVKAEDYSAGHAVKADTTLPDLERSGLIEFVAGRAKLTALGQTMLASG